MFFVLLLVLIKNSYDNSSFDIAGVNDLVTPSDEHAFQPMTFQDALTSLQAAKKCKWVNSNTTDDDGHFEITGIHDRSKNWQIPYVKCDSRRCEFSGQDATLFCEVSVLAITGSDAGGLERAAHFRDWLYTRYPVLLLLTPQQHLLQQPLVQFFEQDVLDDYVQSPVYGTPGHPKIAMGIVFAGNDPDKFSYSLRQNSTNFNAPEQDTAKPAVRTTPQTDKIQDIFATDDFSVCISLEQRGPDLGVLGNSCTGQYMYNGVLAAQRLVHDFVLQATGAVDAGYWVAEAGVQFVQFPQPPYVPRGFFDSNGTYSTVHVFLCCSVD
jgi:hypothetical protein